MKEEVRPGKSLLRGNAQWGAKGKVGESPTGGAREIAQRLTPGGLLDAVTPSVVSDAHGARSGGLGHARELERPAVSKPDNAPNRALGVSVWC